MGIKEHSVTVKVVKRIQEQEFEPFEIQLEESIIFDKKMNTKKIRRKLYNNMKDELDGLIEERLDELYNNMTSRSED